MKIQCDVCSRDEASVLCCADEAALCDACDRRVHHANKLASKHRRFSLSSSEQTQLLLCDICKERRGFVFCQEDRAILCRDCDEPIHSANQLSMKHSRFLLTGSRLSATPLSSTVPLQQDGIEFDNNSNSSEATVEKSNQNNKSMVVKESSVLITPTSTPAPSNGSSSSSSISEYLIKTIPGYCVEDLLVDEANGLFKGGGAVPFSEPELAPAEDFPIWVPQVEESLNFLQTSGFSGSVQCNIGFGLKELNQSQQYYYHHGLKVSREQLSDESFMVPEINTPVSSANKRPRPSSAWDF